MSRLIFLTFFVFHVNLSNTLGVPNNKTIQSTIESEISESLAKNDTLTNQNLISMSSLPKSQPSTIPSIVEYPVCDVALQGTICLNNLQQVILPDAQPFGIVGHYTFDMVKPLDSSGHQNHAIGNTIAASSFASKGSSAFFRKNYIILPNSNSHNETDYSITFWVYLLEDEESKASSLNSLNSSHYCPIIHKGFVSNNKEEFLFESQPSISIDQSAGNIKVAVSTSASPNQNEYFISNFKLRPHKWFHIAVVRYNKRLRLYVNGILDSSILTQGSTKLNSLPFYVGSTPWTQQLCDMPFLLDELKIYSLPIGRDQIQAEAAGALPGIEPSAIFLACTSCTRLQAEESCPELFHLCSNIEMIAGGYQVLKHMGLMPSQAATHVFMSDFSETKNQNETTGIGLCCRDAF